MPVQQVKTARGPGYRWGTAGHVYTGPGAQVKAALQGRAIAASEHNPTRPQKR